jgi:molybdopterin synthase catalytic subunit
MEITIRFTETAIEAPALELSSREIGASVEFRGLVRELEKGEPLAGFFYEAYHPMAENQMRRILTELAVNHPCEAAWFIHRLGWVPVGETSIYLRINSSHRGEAFALCAQALDRMKVDVPIWKRTEQRG